MASTAMLAWEGMNMPALHVEGRYLKDAAGNTVYYTAMHKLSAHGLMSEEPNGITTMLINA